MADPDFVSRPLVYVAGPYTHPDPVENTRSAIYVADWLAGSVGVTPVVPHLNLLWHFQVPHDLGWWYAYDLAILARCDALWRIDGPSEGADREESFARSRGLPVFCEGGDRDSTALAVWAEAWPIGTEP